MIYIFDIDGTLTEPRQPATKEIIFFLDKLIATRKVYFVTGSDYIKAQEQLPNKILNNVCGVFACQGNEFYAKGKLIEKRDFAFPQKLLDELQTFLDYSEYSIATGCHFEFRPAMLNFSIVGRNATPKQRQHYFDWDTLHGQRNAIAAHVNENYDNIEALQGGMISLDITPIGANKSQILHRLEGAHPISFFGDKMYAGGNDYPLKAILYQDNWLNNTGHKCFQTDGPDMTMEILKRI